LGASEALRIQGELASESCRTGVESGFFQPEFLKNFKKVKSSFFCPVAQLRSPKASFVKSLPQGVYPLFVVF
jgi:hypothetical protein